MDRHHEERQVTQRSASPKHPFIGLRPFQIGDHAYFFGRDEEIDVLVRQVRKNRFVSIVGSSGSGKSSLILAGLEPRLKSPRWLWAKMRPGDAPIRELARCLAELTGETGDLAIAWTDRLERALDRSSLGIVDALALIPAFRDAKDNRLLLLVDQFEELFRFANLRSERELDAASAVERRNDATAFVRLLLAAMTATRFTIHIVVTMISDFIGDCARFHGLPEAVSRSQFLVPGMTRDQREFVIREPIRLARGQADPELIQQALNDTNEELDQLPILQHALMRCWDRAAKRAGKGRAHLMLDDYKAVGGVKQALSQHANEIVDDLIQHQGSQTTETATKRIFQALTETDKNGRVIRRPQKFGDLIRYVGTGLEMAEDPPAVMATRTVVESFVNCDFLRAPRELTSEFNH